MMMQFSFMLTKYYRRFAVVVGLQALAWVIVGLYINFVDVEPQDSNNLVLVLAITSALILAFFGVLLLVNIFSNKGFKLIRQSKKLPIRIKSITGFDSEIFVSKHSNLYNSLARVGFDLPSNCGGGGTCGLCRVKLEQADSPPDENHQVLTAQELEQGYRLACQMQVASGLVVQIPPSVLHQQVLECEVISNHFITPLIKELRLKLPPDDDFSFVAGEYVQLHCPPGDTSLSEVEVPPRFAKVWEDNDIKSMTTHRVGSVLREYSMANSPTLAGQLWFNIRLALPSEKGCPAGLGSSYLFSLRPADKIELSGPFGYFHALESKREMIFIGGGAGMAPLRSHILAQLEIVDNTRKIRFFYGARSALEVFYQDEFDSLATKYQNFEWTLALSEPQPVDDWQGPVGYIHQVMDDQYLKHHDDISGCEFYLCGPPAMNEAVLSLLDTLKVPKEQIKCDDFGS